MILRDLLLCGFAYLLGSLSFSVWITRWIKGIDVRQTGSGHATTTNTIRQAGWKAGLLVLALDGLKGFLAVSLAHHFSSQVWAVPVSAGLVVAGHCWPVFARFRGGMGMASAAGSMLAISPLGFLTGFALLLGSILIFHHSARGSAVTGALLAPILALTGFGGVVVAAAAVMGFVVTSRFLMDWNRRYRELWLDREEVG